MSECVSLATDGRGYQKSLFALSMGAFVGSPSSGMTFQHDRSWPTSVLPLMLHDAHKRMFSRRVTPRFYC